MRYRGYQGFRLGLIGYLIITNIILFIATSINRELILLFGLQPGGFLGSPWTIVSNLFIHYDLWHILANMLTLYFFGSYLLQLIRERNFLAVYFCGGILGNIFYMLLAPPFSIAIGASGAVFAVGGALAVMRPNLRVIIFPIPVPMPLWVAVIGGFLVISFFRGVAWHAHLGGLAFGVVIAYFLRRRQRRFF